MLKMHSWLNHRPQSNALVQLIGTNTFSQISCLVSIWFLIHFLCKSSHRKADYALLKNSQCNRPAEVYASGMVNMSKHSCSTTDCWPWGRVKPTATPSKGNYCNSKADYTLKLSNLVQDKCQTLNSCCPFGIQSTVRTNQTALLSLENA